MERSGTLVMEWGNIVQSTILLNRPHVFKAVSNIDRKCHLVRKSGSFASECDCECCDGYDFLLSLIASPPFLLPNGLRFSGPQERSEGGSAASSG
jgi:hypothetical protein